MSKKMDNLPAILSEMPLKNVQNRDPIILPIFLHLYCSPFKTWIWADVKAPAIRLSQGAQYNNMELPYERQSPGL